jgi:hypothetical protein
MVGRFLRNKWMSKSVFFLLFKKLAYYCYPELRLS